MKATNLVALSMAAFCALSSLPADILVKTDGSKPSEGVALSSEPTGAKGNTTTFYRGTGEFRKVGQSFTIEGKTFDLAGLTLKIWDFDPQVEGKKFSIQVYRLLAVNKPPDVVNDLLLSEEGTLPEDLKPEDYLSFTFEKGVKLEHGDSYMILFGFEEATSKDATARSIGFQRTDEKTSDGRLWVYNGEAFTADNKAMTFFLHTK